MAQPTKAQLIAKLQELNIEHEPTATNAVLLSLLPEGTFDEPEEEGDEVTVTYQNPTVGQTERVFSRDVHGKDFRKVAAQFAEKFEGKIN
jgi:hypothetical protein